MSIITKTKFNFPENLNSVVFGLLNTVFFILFVMGRPVINQISHEKRVSLPSKTKFSSFLTLKHGLLNFVLQMGHDKFMVALNFYENRGLLPRKHKFGSFLTLNTCFHVLCHKLT